MTTIYGHVKLKETAEPIADLTVLIAARETLKAPARTNPNASNPFQRYTRTLASALTDAEGKFRIEFDNEARAKSKSQRQTELMLAVLAPATVSAANQSSSNEPFDRLLYWVKLSESAPARTEALAIRLLNGQLDKFDIQVPSRRLKADAERQAAHLIEAEKNSEKLRASIQKELGPLYKKRFEHKRKINAVAKQFASNLYATPKAARSQRNFALSPDQAETAKRNVMEDGLAAMADAASQAKGVTSVYMNPDGMKILGVDEPVAGQAIRIETDKLCQLMNERRGGTELVRVRELLDAYEAKEKANARIGQKGGASPHGSGGSAEETPPAEEAVTPDAAIAQRVLGQLKDMPTVISDNRGSLPKTLTREELNALLPAVQLGAGPTDVPSFHDFYNLQIAFRHVWTEAFDKDLREAIEDLYKDYVQVNEDYSTPVLPGVELQEKEDLLAFLAEVKKLDSAHDRPPTHVSATFDVTSREWNSLSPDQQSELKALSKEIGDTPEDQQDTLVKEGRAIIAAAMGYMTRIARLLSEIALRINEPYSFHHFMPNAVNVGILLTYRQYWQPGPYQVGDLVSTIPLAPGEKRGFEIKQTIKRSRAETELRKSLSSKSVEATTTQRADAEITEKAALRSNFQMTAEGSFRFGIGEISSGTQFGIDRSQESSRTKRDFREAVLKAAQEYRQERTLEVHTTDEHAAESTTSGELSNPNNELTVTYLFTN